MKLSHLRILGFQSFADSGLLSFGPGFNLIVGQNNAGKSAILRALRPSLADDRHRTPEIFEDYRLPRPQIELGLEVTGTELQGAILASGAAKIPVSRPERAHNEVQELLNLPLVGLHVTHTPNNVFGPARYPTQGTFQRVEGRADHFANLAAVSGEIKSRGVGQGSDDNLPQLAFSMWQTGMFHFSAERLSIGKCAHQYANRLTPNADNLPAVLLTMIGSSGSKFLRLVSHIREIFPTVGNISVRPHPGDLNLEIRVWPTEAMENIELSFPLNESGTGVAQAIAILAAIMTVQNSVVIVDEINSFLHPAAIKSLLRIMKTYYQEHQYIISTHSPEVITFGNPETLYLVKRTGYESHVERLNLDDIHNFTTIAEHLGVSMSDVFAAERIIWVEGQTEELCFPFLYMQSFGALPRGTVISAVSATGDFFTGARNRRLVIEIYRRLSAAASPLGVRVRFSFDAENLPPNKRAEIESDSGGLVHFLPRRHLECYVVNPEAIAAFLSERDAVEARDYDATLVEGKIRDLASQPEFRMKWRGNLADPEWLEAVNAARLIDRACKELSDQRVTFSKKDDTLFLLQRVLTSAPDTLAPLTDYVRNLVDATLLTTAEEI